MCVCVSARVGEYMPACVCGCTARACAFARVALLVQDATRIRNIGCCLHHVFRYYLINGTIFEKKLSNIKFVF